MSRDWEALFSTWSQGPSKTENDRSENAESQIRHAIKASKKLKNRNIKVFTQGSYYNRVNVRKDSDVDVGIVCYDTFFPEYPDENIKMELNKSLPDSTYKYHTFKNEIEEALVTYFGQKSITRGNKSFDIKENTNRVEADVAAFFEHRRYSTSTEHLSGVQMLPDDMKPLTIINWPDQHYQNGVDKNSLTSRRYKRVVRILKTLSNEMANNGILSAANTPSFLIECLTFNAPENCFNHSTFKPMVRSVLTSIFNDTITTETCSEWGEVNELKYLFNCAQPWTRHEAHQFLSDAWDYIGYN